jgi:hypothetical protein
VPILRRKETTVNKKSWVDAGGILMRDFGCDRDRYITLKKRTLGESICLRNKNVARMVAVEDLSRVLAEEYKFSLDTVSTDAAHVYIGIIDPVVKQAVLKCMEQAIKTGTNPFTKAKFAEGGLTVPLMHKIVNTESARLGKPMTPWYTRVDILLTPDIAKKLRKEAETRGVSISKLSRIYIANCLSNRGIADES